MSRSNITGRRDVLSAWPNSCSKRSMSFSRLGVALATLKQAITSIPIVLIASDPVGSGFVASLSRPGGNVTGLSMQAPESAGKRLELLRQLVPSLRRLAILFDSAYPAAVSE